MITNWPSVWHIKNLYIFVALLCVFYILFHCFCHFFYFCMKITMLEFIFINFLFYFHIILKLSAPVFCIQNYSFFSFILCILSHMCVAMIQLLEKEGRTLRLWLASATAWMLPGVYTNLCGCNNILSVCYKLTRLLWLVWPSLSLDANSISATRLFSFTPILEEYSTI